MFLCASCDEPYESNGDCSGVCEGCRDELDLRAMIDRMDDDEYAEFMAARSRKTTNATHLRPLANDNRPAAEQTGRDIANFFKGLTQ